MWTLSTSRNDESSKCRWLLVPYMTGRLYDVGCGPYKVFPHATGIDSGKAWGKATADVHVETAERLDFAASQTVDCLFSSHLLEHLDDWQGALREWLRVLRAGGHLCLYLPHRDFYPQVGNRQAWRNWFALNKERFKSLDDAVEAYVKPRRDAGETRAGYLYADTPWGNEDHKRDFVPEDIIEVMRELGGVDLVENEERNDDDEYSFWQVWKKLPNKREFAESWKNVKPAKTAAVTRFGAQGDNIQASSVLPWLKENGFHVTFFCQTGLGHEVIRHDPHIDRFIVLERDAIPNQFLAEFWESEKKKYTKWINLCESIEGTLLAAPGRSNFNWPNEARALHMDRNYLEWTHALAEVPSPYRPKFYSTLEERAWARKTSERWGRRNILWSLAGSSGHKVWPHLDAVIAGLMLEYHDVHVVLVGDEACQILEIGWEKEPRVHCQSGKWTIRESMAFAEVADIIIGTETGLLNAAGSMDAWKIVTLSHSSQEMLTKHWKNVITLEQPEGVGCPKHPCRQLHGAEGHDPWEACPSHEDDEMKVALCQYHVSADMMFAAIQRVLGVPVAIQRRAA